MEKVLGSLEHTKTTGESQIEGNFQGYSMHCARQSNQVTSLFLSQTTDKTRLLLLLSIIHTLLIGSPPFSTNVDTQRTTET